MIGNKQTNKQTNEKHQFSFFSFRPLRLFGPVADSPPKARAKRRITTKNAIYITKIERKRESRREKNVWCAVAVQPHL